MRRVAAESCPCGRTFDVYQGGILGRTDDMRIVRGTNIHPSAVEGVVRQFAEIREFRIVASPADITVQLEPLPEVREEEREPLARRIADELAYAHEGLRFSVQVMDPGALPTFELKARRLVDA